MKLCAEDKNECKYLEESLFDASDDEAEELLPSTSISKLESAVLSYNNSTDMLKS